MNPNSQYVGNKWSQRLFAALVCFSMAIMASFAQTFHVKGVVNDAMGPILGASILEKGTGNGVASDGDGNFEINVKDANAVLVISFVGLQTKEVPLKGQSTVEVFLEENAILEEVVVVGYGSMRKKDLTGSVTQINPDKIADSNPATVQDVLRGTAGLQIGYSPDAKGGGSILLRGRNSVYNDTKDKHNTPLIVLDGMIFEGDLSEINPDIIGQIDVLKDASSTAIYGSKAASGVIIITTKKGKISKPTINVTANLAANTKARFREVYSPEGYLKFREDWYRAKSYQKQDDGTYAYTVSDDYYTLQGAGSKEEYARRLLLADGKTDRILDNYLAGRTTNWEDETFRTGLNQDYNASITGATENFSYYLSVGYLNNEGVIRGNDFSTTRLNMKLNSKITNWLEIGANVNFQDRTAGDIQVPLGENYWDNNLLRNSPYASVNDENGNYLQHPNNYSSENGGYNFWFERQYLDLDKGYTVLNSIFNAKVKLPFNITYDFNIAPRMQWYHDNYFMSAEQPNSVANDRGANRNNGRTLNWILNNIVTWDQSFDKHHFTVTMAQEASKSQTWRTAVSARNLGLDVTGYHLIDGADMQASSISSLDTYQTNASYLGRVFYSYNDRYMVTASYRHDGYSGFGRNNPWADFWSIGPSWVFSDEDFFKDFDWMNTGKLRISYGTNGNSSLDDAYKAITHLTVGNSMVYPTGANTTTSTKTVDITLLGNLSLEWEKTRAVNVGLDFGFLDDLVSGSFEWYHKETRDMIMTQRLPRYSGFSKLDTNLGQVNNTGIELTINTNNITTKDFKWSSTVTFTYNKNEIVHLYGDLDENGKEPDDLASEWYIGKPIGEIWEWETDGIWQIDEAKEAALVDQQPGDPKVVNHYTADDIILADGTRKPVYNNNDKVFLGTTIPPVYWTFRNDFRYKDWTASISMYSNAGHKSKETYYMNNDNAGSMITNGCNTYKKKGYWTPENPSNTYARLDAQNPPGATAYRLHNRTFVRLDDVTIGYTVPKKWTQKAAIDKLHVTMGVKNLFTIDNYEYGDPETGGLSTRIFNFGLNFTL